MSASTYLVIVIARQNNQSTVILLLKIIITLNLPRRLRHFNLLVTYNNVNKTSLKTSVCFENGSHVGEN